MQISLEKELEIIKIVSVARNLSKEEVVELLHSSLILFCKTEAAYKEIIGQQMLSGMYHQSGIKGTNSNVG